jgi:hypothetical protein
MCHLTDPFKPARLWLPRLVIWLDYTALTNQWEAAKTPELEPILYQILSCDDPVRPVALKPH